MAHNVTTLRDRAHHDPFGSLGPNLPVKGDALLTVRGGLPERPATILFHHGRDGLQRRPQVVLHPWETDGAGRTVAIAGEDLFAFRELLNELPESAFVRPADPVEEFYVLEDRDGDWWAYDDVRGKWVVATVGESVYNFRDSAGLTVKGGPDDWHPIALRDQSSRPVWTDGDIVKPSAKSGITYIRRDGRWDRHSRDQVSRHNTGDAAISDLVARGYLVVLQQNA